MTARDHPGSVTGAIEALREALERCATALEDAPVAGNVDDVDALAVVIALDDTLPAIARLREAVPSWVHRAEAGEAVASHLVTSLSDEELSRTLADLRAAVTEAGRREDERRARVAELGELRDRLMTLRRLELLASALNDLEGQRQELDARMKALLGPVTSAEQALTRGASDLLRLSDERFAALDPAAQEALRRAADAQARVRRAEQAAADAREEAALARERYETLEAEHTERLAAMRRHLEADRAVAAGLGASGALTRGGVEATSSALGEITAHLDRIDRILAEALDTARERAPRRMSGWDTVPR